MMEDAPAVLRELAPLQDIVVVCSSTGWTDEKHMLYLKLLEESFVSQLHDNECNFKGLFNCSPRLHRRTKSSKHILKHAAADQYLEIAEGHRANPYTKVDSTESPGNRQDENVHSMDDNASTTEPVPEAIPHARAASSGQSSSCYVGKHRHSPSRSADFYKRTTRISSEGSDQNFDEETKGFGESRGRRDPKRLKPNDDVKSAQVVPSVKAEFQQAGCIDTNVRDGDNRDSLFSEAGSPSCKDHGPKE